MKPKRKKESVREKQVSKDYAGTEASPYQEWRVNKGNYNQESDSQELPEANPDVLLDEQGLYYYKQELNELQLEAVYKAMKFLTVRQKQALELVGFEGKTLENAGAIMGISRGNVLDLINRARKIIKRQVQNPQSGGNI